MKNDFLYKILLVNIIDVFWLIEDILELDSDANCEFLDDMYLSVLKTDLSSIEIETIFKMYKFQFVNMK